MQFINFAAILSGLAIPGLILLYLLKQRYQQITVSSTFLWDQVLSQWEAAHPWQKFRKNWLLFLQILILALLTIALMRPVVLGKAAGQSSIYIVDTSLSMQANEDGQTRLDRAKTYLIDMASQLKAGNTISMILAGKENTVLLADEGDIAKINSSIGQIVPENGSNDLSSAIALSESLQTQEQAKSLFVLTDYDFQGIKPEKEETTYIKNFAQGSSNVAMRNIAHTQNKDSSYQILCVIQNFSAAKSVTVELVIDDELVDVQEIALPANEVANLMFEDIRTSGQRVTARIQQNDALIADNQAYHIIQPEQQYRVLLVSSRNVFLEKAILLRSDIELFKSTLQESIAVSGYDLIIFDGVLPEKLPENQALLVINPPEAQLMFMVETVNEGKLKVTNNELIKTLLQFVNFDDIEFSKAKVLQTFDASKLLPLITIDGKPLLAIEQSGLFKQMFIGWDFHDTNLPMKKDFPIFIQNILQWYLPASNSQTELYLPGDTATFSLRANTQGINVIDPNGLKFDNNAESTFNKTFDLGIYQVELLDQDKKLIQTDYFVVQPPIESESMLQTRTNFPDQMEQADTVFSFEQAWTNYCILAILLILMAEWWVYYHGI